MFKQSYLKNFCLIAIQEAAKRYNIELFEIEVVNKAMANIFDSLSQNLPEIPAIYADDIINIIKSDKNPKENIVKFLTDKIISQIRSSLENAENTTRKYYEET